INGAERVIVTQLQRSPGVDFGVEVHPSGKRLHSCRIIPERGSWIQVEVTSKDSLVVKIDRSGKIPATMFLRALAPELSTNADILRAFYETEVVELTPRNLERLRDRALCVSEVTNVSTGEVILASGAVLSAEVLDQMRNYGIEKLEVMYSPSDELILNTLAEDESRNHEDALKRLYVRLRPGTPVTLEKAKDLFHERFFDDKRYNFGAIGRFRINRKFQIEDDDRMTLNGADLLNVCHYILKLRAGEGKIDDIDHMENRRARSIKDLIMAEIRNAMIKLRRGVREQMVIKDINDVKPHQLLNATIFSSAIDYFFQRGELSQVVDQSNPLAQLVHERRLSALGPGGLNRKRAGFEVRDVHTSHYGRICPVETPEGTNIGLIVSLATYAVINDYGFLLTPYYVVKNRRITDELVYLRADEEIAHYIAQANVPADSKGRIIPDRVMCRHNEEFTECAADQVTLIDVAPQQLVGISASLIPFLEHDDANRALMGSNMQRQAVPLIKPEIPLVATGMERMVVRNSGMIARASEDGVVTYADAQEIRVTSSECVGGERVYRLHKYKCLNDGTTLNQTPLVRRGDKVKKNDPLTEGAATVQGELALGRNVLVAFMVWEGYNFEDAILVSEKLIREDSFTSIHIEEFSVEVRETKIGTEEITRDIPGVSEAMLANLDADGLIRIGTKVKPGDILVGKIAPKAKTEFSSEEKLLRAIFGRAGEDVKNESLVVPPGTEGYVIAVQRFSRHSPTGEEERRAARRKCEKLTAEMRARVAEEIKIKFRRLEEVLGGEIRTKRGKVLRLPRVADYERLIELQQQMLLADLDIPPAKRARAQAICVEHDRRIRFLETRCDVECGRLLRGDELRPGVLEMVRVLVAVKRKLSLGDKMAGRHGNKGVVARILPEEDMPFLEDGTPIEMILNPLGVPSRMNVGQILETHLGWAAHKLGFRAITPVFDGCREEEIFAALAEAGLPADGKTVLYDGRTGEPFHERVTVGMMYVMKLHHLVAEKIHARATGPYSLITQQPLGGKARNGGQRFGEMEVWALEAYGAANILQELLTVKSDDVEGRTKIYEAMVKGENTVEPGMPVSFDVLCNEIRGLALNIRLEKPQPTVPASLS
ncbi:MAG: DNA-directed RNA polymerase subunit beta, partial [Planctomycetota bacterium]|nr:DNA-directed RNA polymerase subunit beta [Planctomycetota bacterium]